MPRDEELNFFFLVPDANNTRCERNDRVRRADGAETTASRRCRAEVFVVERSAMTDASGGGGDDDAVRWRCIASSEDLRLVSSKRVRFTSIDVTPAHIFLGANTGSAYVFARTVDGEDEASTSGRGGGLDRAECKARFVTTLTPEVIDFVAHGSRLAPQSVSAIRVSPCGRLCAMGFIDGSVRVIELDGLATGEATQRRSSFGATVGYLLTSHGGQRITALRWSSNGRELFAGSDRGMITVMCFADFLEWCDGGRVGERPPTTNKTEFVELASKIHQVDISPSDVHAILSAECSAQVLVITGGVKVDIGSKQREGAYGSCFHRYSTRSLDDDGVEEEEEMDEWADGDLTSEPVVEHAVLARPGRKLWIAKFKSDRQKTVPEVLATLKPEVPAPSTTPGWKQPEHGLTADQRKRLTKKFEFGLLHELGPCMLSTSERAVAIVDIASPAITRWYPFKESGSEDLSAGFVDMAVSHHRAFFLTPAGDMGNSVWCLESFADVRRLIEDTWRDKTSVTRVIDALELCRKLDFYDEPLFELGRELVETSDVQDPGVKDALNVLIRWGADVGTKLPSIEDVRADVREKSTAAETIAPSPIQLISRPHESSGKPPSGKPPATAVAALALPKEGVSAALGEYPKAESDGGIFFYNPRGVAKTTKDTSILTSNEIGSAENSPAKTKPAKVVLKRQAQIIEDDEDEEDAREQEPSSPPANQLAKVSLVPKDFKVEIPVNEQDWIECDKFDDAQWRSAIQAAEAALVDEGARFEHWSTYDALAPSKTSVASSGTNLRLEYRTAMQSRVNIVVKCAEELTACRVSLDATQLIPSLRQWRDICEEMLQLSTAEDSSGLPTYPCEALLYKIEHSLRGAVDELDLDTPALKKTTPERQRAHSKEQHSTPPILVSVELQALKDAFFEYNDDEKSVHSAETDLVESLRAVQIEDATTVVVDCARRALSELASSFSQDSPQVSKCSARIERLTRIGSAVLGPSAMIKCITEATEDEVLAKIIAPQRATEPVAVALSKILTTATVWLSTEHAIDLGLRRNAAKLLEPLDAHLYRPPPRTYGRFPQLRAALEAEIVSPDAVEALPFVRRRVADDEDDNADANAWTLKIPHVTPISPSIEDRGDWGVKMDLSACPACRRSVLARGASDIITFPCSHTFHAACALDGACTACLARSPCM